MIDMQISAPDMAELNRDMIALRSENLLRGEMDPLGQAVVKEVSPYPAELPTSRRTGNLGASWWYRALGMKANVGNYADYAGYVQGEEQTTRHRITGWKNILDVASSQMDKLVDKVSRRIDQIWRT